MVDLPQVIANAKSVQIIQSYKGILNFSVKLNMDDYEVSGVPAGYEFTSDDGSYYLIQTKDMKFGKTFDEYEDYVFNDENLEIRIIITR